MSRQEGRSAEGKGRKVFVLGLDGVPHSFLLRAFAEGLLPNLARLSAASGFTRMTSVIPTVSSVAWASYMTGCNPGRHGIFGFVERRGDSYDIYVPTSLNLSAPTLWEVAGAAGRKVIVMNVPMTYPPRPVNGILISDFLCTNIDKVAYPPELSAWLRETGYRIDADARLARQSLERFAADVRVTLERRFETAFRLMEDHPWDFFQLHVMETDRVNHFLLPGEGGDDPLLPAHRDFHRRLDELVGETERRIGDDTLFVLLSDHGFCRVRSEVYLNQYLLDKGLLRLPEGKGLPDLLPESEAYSLIPGRVWVNLKGREPRGSVDPGRFEEVREKVSRALLDLTDPSGGRKVIAGVERGEKLFHGARKISAGGLPPAVPPDLVAVPEDGYDLKGEPGRGVFGRTELVGMHTHHDAFLMVRGQDILSRGVPSIIDVMPSILRRMGVTLPEEVDGRPVF